MHAPDFQSVVTGQALTGGQWMSQLFSDMNFEKIDALGKALGISSEKIIQSVQSGTALQTSATSASDVDDIVKKLWEQKSDSNAFVLGSELLKSGAKENIQKCSLLGDWVGFTSPLALAVDNLVRSDQSVDIVLQELQGLHEKMVQTGSARHDNWQYSIVSILTRACDSLGVHSPQVIAIAQVAIQQNWLEPEHCPHTEAGTLHVLLKRLDAINELKASVQRLLKNWYTHFYGKKRDTDIYIRIILGAVSPLALPIYSGHSPMLEAR
ncbi:hypothetical protein, partial [Sansalvadorimonas verongulae]|uniref:hypothetical protein n=1 Tax=Sansalvadorimonas verongulae TaxID=2172824 RepID=UPI001E44E8B7